MILSVMVDNPRTSPKTSLPTVQDYYDVLKNTPNRALISSALP
ncbi:MAG: hypothetical protein ACLR1V_05790 [Coprococcus sp.]